MSGIQLTSARRVFKIWELSADINYTLTNQSDDVRLRVEVGMSLPKQHY